MTNQPAFTPGPLTWRPAATDTVIVIESKASPLSLGSVYTHGHANGKANAALWTAAPDLYEALDMLLDRTAQPVTDHAFYTYEEAVAKARVALAKARGEHAL